MLWQKDYDRGKYTKGHVSSEKGVARDREGFIEKVRVKLGLEACSATNKQKQTI